MGCMKLGIPKPQDLRKKQAVAAAGQSQLMRMYEALVLTMTKSPFFFTAACCTGFEKTDSLMVKTRCLMFII